MANRVDVPISENLWCSFNIRLAAHKSFHESKLFPNKEILENGSRLCRGEKVVSKMSCEEGTRKEKPQLGLIFPAPQSICAWVICRGQGCRGTEWGYDIVVCFARRVNIILISCPEGVHDTTDFACWAAGNMWENDEDDVTWRDSTTTTCNNNRILYCYDIVCLSFGGIESALWLLRTDWYNNMNITYYYYHDRPSNPVSTLNFCVLCPHPIPPGDKRYRSQKRAVRLRCALWWRLENYWYSYILLHFFSLGFTRRVTSHEVIPVTRYCMIFLDNNSGFAEIWLSQNVSLHPVPREQLSTTGGATKVFWKCTRPLARNFQNSISETCRKHW